MNQQTAPTSATVKVLRVWLIGSAVALASFLIWTVAPVLFLVLALAAGLGGLSALVVMLARRLERWKHGGTPPPPEA